MDNLTPRHTEAKNWFVSSFDGFAAQLNGNGALPFHRTRRDALARFADLGFPTPRNEEWKYTNVEPILDHRFELQHAPAAVPAKALAPFLIAGISENLLVFVNGRFAPELSRVATRARGLVIDSLAAALQRGEESAHRHLAKYADYQNEAFIALNTAFALDGAFIEVPRGLAVAEPIHLLYVTTTGDDAFVAHPRNLIVAGAGSQVELVESYHHLGAAVYFNNIVTEVVMEPQSVVEHVRLQEESRRAFHIAAREVHQGQGSVYASVSVDLGGALVRNNFNLRLLAENCEGSLHGFYFGAGEQLVDNHTLIDHAKPHCQSNEHYKGILGDRARGVFNGKVMVRPQAQKTNAYQSNQCLLLSDDAIINTKPQLEIFADDVKCSHGATIGQLDEEAVFYMRTRGVSLAEANTILRHAFAGEVLQHIKMEPVRETVDHMVTGHFRKYLKD